MIENNAKSTLTFRLDPQLKEDLTTEAKVKNLTVSGYVESLLMSRELDDAGEATTIQSLRERIIELEFELEKYRHSAQLPDVHANVHVPATELSDFSDKIAQLTIANKSLRQRNFNLEEHTKQLVNERNTLAKMQGKVIPHWMTQDGYELLIKVLKKMHTLHPDLSPEHTLLSSVAVTLKNESNLFSVYTLSDFLKANPYFLTPQLSIQ
jgi:hypothetical protein